MAWDHSLFPIALVKTHNVPADLNVIVALIANPKLVSGTYDQSGLVSGWGSCCKPSNAQDTNIII